MPTWRGAVEKCSGHGMVLCVVLCVVWCGVVCGVCCVLFLGPVNSSGPATLPAHKSSCPPAVFPSIFPYSSRKASFTSRLGGAGRRHPGCYTRDQKEEKIHGRVPVRKGPQQHGTGQAENRRAGADS